MQIKDEVFDFKDSIEQENSHEEYLPLSDGDKEKDVSESLNLLTGLSLIEVFEIETLKEDYKDELDEVSKAIILNLSKYLWENSTDLNELLKHIIKVKTVKNNEDVSAIPIVNSKDLFNKLRQINVLPYPERENDIYENLDHILAINKYPSILSIKKLKQLIEHISLSRESKELPLDHSKDLIENVIQDVVINKVEGKSVEDVKENKVDLLENDLQLEYAEDSKDEPEGYIANCLNREDGKFPNIVNEEDKIREEQKNVKEERPKTVSDYKEYEDDFIVDQEDSLNKQQNDMIDNNPRAVENNFMLDENENKNENSYVQEIDIG